MGKTLRVILLAAIAASLIGGCAEEPHVSLGIALVVDATRSVEGQQECVEQFKELAHEGCFTGAQVAVIRIAGRTSQFLYAGPARGQKFDNALKNVAVPAGPEAGSNIYAGLEQAGHWLLGMPKSAHRLVVLISDCIADPAKKDGRTEYFRNALEWSWSRVAPATIEVFSLEAASHDRVIKAWSGKDLHVCPHQPHEEQLSKEHLKLQPHLF